MPLTYDKPTKTGYYWFQPYNPVNGLPDGNAEVVYVVFQVSYRRKLVDRVCGRFWQCNLDQVINAKWSDEIICPSFS